MNDRKRQLVRLGRPRRLALYVVSIGVWLSGGLWLLFHYLFVEQGDFGLKTHPLEPWWLKLHGAFAFAAIWMFGLLWGVHVTTAWPFARRRLSGGAMTGILVWLSVSGYLLYYLGDDTVRSFVAVLHWAIGLACPIVYLAHRFNYCKRSAGKEDLMRRVRQQSGLGSDKQQSSVSSRMRLS